MLLSRSRAALWWGSLKERWKEQAGRKVKKLQERRVIIPRNIVMSDFGGYMYQSYS